MPVWPLPRITFQDLATVEETRPVALLTADDVWGVLGSELDLPIFIQAEPANYDRDLFDYLAENLPSRVEVIYAIGQGAPVQAGKFVAAHNRRPLVIVPTALDSDALLTPLTQSEETIDGQRRLVELETGPATDILIDWDVIRAAPDAVRGAGLVDVLSIVTGLLDWRFSAQKGKNPRQERFTPWAASVAAGLASQAIKNASAIGQGRQDALETLLNLMMMTAQLANQLGHRRATQGGEHYLAQVLAGQTQDNLTHAELVGPCLLFVAALHGQDVSALREAMTRAGIPLDRVRATDFSLMLDHLPEYIGSLGLPYSILNELEPGRDETAAALDAAGLALAHDTWEMPADVLTAPDAPPAAETGQATGEETADNDTEPVSATAEVETETASPDAEAGPTSDDEPEEDDTAGPANA